MTTPQPTPLDYEPSPAHPSISSKRELTAGLLLALGVAAAAVLYLFSAKFNPALLYAKQHAWIFEEDAWEERTLLAFVLVLAIVPFTRKIIAWMLGLVRCPSPLMRRITALATFFGSGPLLYKLAAAKNRLMWPIWHDENMYRLQTTFFLHGKLVMPPLKMWEFFEVPYVFVKQCYAPVYFPGTALLHVPAAWLGLPYVVTPLIIASVILTLIYLIVTELLDGVSGLLAVLLMISLVLFRWLALTEMSHPAGAMFGLIVSWSWLCWRRSRKTPWIALAGIAGAWYAITRPLDAVCILTPIALIWAWEMRRDPLRIKLRNIAMLLVLASPFIGLQLALDHALTGHWLEAPLDVYNREYLHVKSLGLQTYDPEFVPDATKQIQDVYYWGNQKQIEDFTTVKDAFVQWVIFRLPTSFGVGLPSLLLVFLIPIAAMELADIRRRMMWAIYWAYMLGMSCFYLFAQQYVLAIAPAIIFTVLLGARATERAIPYRGIAAVLMPLVIFTLAAHRIYLNEQGAYNLNEKGTVLQINYEVIPAQVKSPALVMCHYDSTEIAPLQEPVYNWDALTPDDAPIIRAHDLGEDENRRLYQYYAKTKPDMNVWIFDHIHKKLARLGSVKDLAAATPAGRPTSATRPALSR